MRWKVSYSGCERVNRAKEDAKTGVWAAGRQGWWGLCVKEFVRGDRVLQWGFSAQLDGRKAQKRKMWVRMGSALCKMYTWCLWGSLLKGEQRNGTVAGRGGAVSWKFCLVFGWRWEKVQTKINTKAAYLHYRKFEASQARPCLKQQQPYWCMLKFFGEGNW